MPHKQQDRAVNREESGLGRAADRSAAGTGGSEAEDPVQRRHREFEAAHPHVRIWHDAGGWHARWPVRGGKAKTGVTHPSELGGLLDRLDALEAAERGRA
jgi:hypothetical protein